MVSIGMMKILSKIRHPRRAYFYISRLMREKNSRKHKSRINEYKKFQKPIETAISLATGVANLNKIKQFDKEVKEKNLEELCSTHGLPYPMAKALYAVCRALKPMKVVETGVAHGLSSRFMLEALKENRRGSLYSIDLPVDIPPPLLGVLVPSGLKDRWVFVKGESLRELPSLLNRLGIIDIFLHDSEHTYGCMFREFTYAWQHLARGGLLMADDVDWNDALIDFCEKERVNPIIFQVSGHTFGVIKKP